MVNLATSWLGIAATCGFAVLPAVAQAQRHFRDLELIHLGLGRAPLALCVAELDGDGALDVAVTHDADARLSVLPGRDAGEWGAPVELKVGLGPIQVRAGDLDGNGRADLVTVNTGSASLSVLLHRGDGNFAPVVGVSLAANPRAVQLADLDRDGALDAASVSAVGPERGILTVHLGDGTGTLREEGRYAVGDNPHALVVEDLDGDGFVDAAIAHTSTVSWFVGLGRDGFRPPVRTPLRVNPRSLAAGDFDHDGATDLAATSDSSEVLFLASQGAGALGQETIARTGIAGVQVGAFLVAADIDIDGHTDLAMQESRGRFNTAIVRSRGGGQFEVVERVSIGSLLTDLALADVDGDQDLDAFAPRLSPDEVTLIVSPGPGRLDERLEVPLSTSPGRLIPLDWEGDGDLDLATPTPNALVVLRAAGRRALEAPLQLAAGGFLRDAVPWPIAGDPAVPSFLLSDLAGHRLILARVAAGTRLETLAEHPAGEAPGALAAADFDADGLLDAAVLDQAALGITIILDPSSREARRGGVSPGGPATALAAGDLDGDGIPDLAAASRERLEMFTGDGRGAFAPPRRETRAAGARALLVADLDGDGHASVVAALPQAQGLIVLGAADEPGVGLDAGRQVLTITALDVDGDGLLDLAGTESEPFDAVVVHRQTAGGWEAGERYHTGAEPRWVAIADLDGDGHADAITSDADAPGISVLWGDGDGTVGYFRRGDSDGDAALTIADAVTILDRLFRGAAPLACEDAADADDDGALRLTDALMILLHLFQGGAPPPAPGPDECGPDGTQDTLSPCAARCR